MTDIYNVLSRGESVSKNTKKKTEECKYLGKCPALDTLSFVGKWTAYHPFYMLKLDVWKSLDSYAEKAKVVHQGMTEIVCKKSGDKHELCPAYQFMEKRKYV